MVDRVIVRIDLHPARVSIAGTTYDSLRVVVTDTHLLAYRLGPSGPELQLEFPVTGEIGGSLAVGYDIPTEVGVVNVDKSGGCSGCGNRLGSVDLFPDRQRVVIGLRR